jgi:DNA-binding GntR family transcriptional regulator
MKVRRGAYVTEVSEQDLRQVYELLALLESDAAGAVCAQATDEELATLKHLHEALEEAARPDTGSRELFFELNEAFHMQVLALARNRWRTQMVADLRKVMKLNRHSSLFKSGRIEESLKEHRAILSALLARDAARAVHSVRTHFNNGLQAAV